EPPVVPEPVPTELRPIEPLDLTNAKERTLELTISITPQDVTMGINGQPYWKAEAIEATIGDVEIWNLVNNTDFAHPFHLHGYFFQVLDDARVPEWKDTFDVPAKSSRRIAVAFDERPGVWMYHCHILDHAEIGMMGHLVVRAPGQTFIEPVPPTHIGHSH